MTALQVYCVKRYDLRLGGLYPNKPTPARGGTVPYRLWFRFVGKCPTRDTNLSSPGSNISCAIARTFVEFDRLVQPDEGLSTGRPTRSFPGLLRDGKCDVRPNEDCSRTRSAASSRRGAGNGRYPKRVLRVRTHWLLNCSAQWCAAENDRAIIIEPW